MVLRKVTDLPPNAKLREMQQNTHGLVQSIRATPDDESLSPTQGATQFVDCLMWIRRRQSREGVEIGHGWGMGPKKMRGALALPYRHNARTVLWTETGNCHPSEVLDLERAPRPLLPVSIACCSRHPNTASCPRAPTSDTSTQVTEGMSVQNGPMRDGSLEGGEGRRTPRPHQIPHDIEAEGTQPRRFP